jgi:hypothetical protein
VNLTERESVPSNTRLNSFTNLSTTGCLTWNLLLAVAFAGSLAYILFNPLSTSVGSALYLQAGEMLLDGQTPYVDFVDVNPPLIIYFSALWAGAAKLFGLHPILIFSLGVWLLSGLSVLATREILRATFSSDESYHADLLAIALSLGLLWVLTPQKGVGEREHLFMIAFLPYLAIRFRRWENEVSSIPLATVAGLLAGIATCLKPQFLAIVLAPELYLIVTRRRVRPLFAPETFALAAAGVGYAVHFLLLPEGMRTELFARWIPLIVERYWVFENPLSVILRENVLWVGIGLCMGVAVFIVHPERASPAWRFAQTLTVVALAGLVLLFAQHTGWAYHAIPAQFAFLGVIGLLVAEMGHLGFTNLRAPFIKTLNLVLGAILLAMAALCGAFVIRAWSGAPLASIVASSWFAREIIENTAPRDYVLFVSTGPIHAYPLLVQLDRRPGSKFLWLFPIPMLYANVPQSSDGYPYHTSAAQSEEERLTLQELSNDIARKQPVLVFIEISRCEFCPPRFSLLEYLKLQGFFETVLSDYAVYKERRDWVVLKKK